MKFKYDYFFTKHKKLPCYTGELSPAEQLAHNKGAVCLSLIQKT